MMDHVRAMGEAAGSLSLAASGQSESIEGNVRISVSDLKGRKADIAVRLFAPTQGDLIAKKNCSLGNCALTAAVTSQSDKPACGNGAYHNCVRG